MSSYGTQCDRLLRWLESGRSITPLQSWTELGIYRLGARVWDLRKQGYPIVKKIMPVKNSYGETCHVASYWMMDEMEEQQ